MNLNILGIFGALSLGLLSLLDSAASHALPGSGMAGILRAAGSEVVEVLPPLPEIPLLHEFVDFAASFQHPTPAA